MEEFRGPEITHLITPPTPKKTRLEKKKQTVKEENEKGVYFPVLEAVEQLISNGRLTFQW